MTSFQNSARVCENTSALFLFLVMMKSNRMRTAFLATVAMLFACNQLPYELTPQEEAQLAKLEDKMDDVFESIF